MFGLLILMFDRAVWSTYNNVLHMMLNSGIANIAVIIRGDKQIVVCVPIS
jgi:hypothetical protein